MKRNLETEKKIIAFFKDRSQIQQKSINLLFSQDKAIEIYCNFMLCNILELGNIFNVIKYITKREVFKYCKNCGRQLKFGYSGNFCSMKCRNNDKAKIEKARIALKHTLENDKDRATKLKATNEKKRQTYLKRYGCECNLQSDESKKKSSQTMLEKYGVEHPSQVEEIKEKQRASYEKTMHEHHDEIVSKIKKTIFEKHGGYVWNKNRAKNRFHQMWLHIQEYSEFIFPLFDESELDHLKSGKIYEWKCAKCGNVFKAHIHKTSHISEFPDMPRGLKCFPYMSCFSKAEKNLLAFVKQHFKNAHKDRRLIHPLELDIVIPELKIALEFNGCWFHNASRTAKGTHLRKTLLCNEKGYRLIHIWEDEWHDSEDKIKERLVKIFKGEEDLSFTDELIKLDRSWYNNIEIPRLFFS